MKKQLLEIWESKIFQIGMDICRILLIIMAVLIFYKLVTEIEIVKMLNSDPCELCMNKTGAVCYYPWQVDSIGERKIPEFNSTQFDKLMNKTDV